jgi:signal transduction histidine kinase
MRVVPSLLRFVGHRRPFNRISGELIGTEGILAAARVVFAATSLLALYVDPIRPFHHKTLIYAILFCYGAYAISVLVWVQLRKQLPRSGTWGIHFVDTLWPSIITLYTNGPNSPFFSFFIFALLAAAFRWGMYQALLTAVTAVTLVAGQSILLRYESPAGSLGAEFTIQSFIVSSAYLATCAILLGYFSESQKRRREQAITVARIWAQARVDVGLKHTLESTFEQILKAFGAREVLLIASEAGAYSTNLWHMEILPGLPEPVFTVRQLEPPGEQKYVFALPEDCAGVAWRGGILSSAICVRRDSSRLHATSCRLDADFITQHRFATLLLSTVSPAPDVLARIFLLDPKLGGPLDAQLRFLQELTNHVTPAVYNVYLLRRLRSRAVAIERARVARDLHDGIIQSLHAVAFRLYALRTSNMGTEERRGELLELQELVQKEAANLRTLLQQLKPIDVDPRHVVDFLSGMIDRFRYDTGIAAQFVCDVPDLSLPPSTCREVARIVQEALANVLKHSGAANVLVWLGSNQGRCKLTIEDDGRGFEFAGRFDHVTLEKLRRGPSVIKERVRVINGQISIESRPGQGARLEITFSQVSPSSIS